MQQTAYLELKLAWELFKQAPETLESPQRDHLARIVARQHEFERRILRAPAAATVVVPKATLDSRLTEIRRRYQTNDELLQELVRIGLDTETLADAVERDLKVEAILDRVAAAIPAVTEVDAEIYYRLHPAAFDRPEARQLRHILITFDSPAEGEKAKATLENLRTTLQGSHAFGQAALRHSQCPTALEGGRLGTVKRGQLYAELEPAAFALKVGETSPVLQSPVGLHILYCDEILPHGMLPFDAVREHIIERLTDKRRQEAQRDWIKGL